jgi:hypothetical protein
MNSCNICPLVSGLFHLMSSKFIFVVAHGRISFLFKAEKHSIVCIQCTFVYSVSIDSWVVSTSWLLCRMQKSTWECRCLFDILTSIFFDKCPEVGLLDHMVVLFLIFLLFYYPYVHTRLGSFLPPAPTPSLTTHSAPIFNFFKETPLYTIAKPFYIPTNNVKKGYIFLIIKICTHL